MVSHYIVRVVEQGVEKYLFGRRLLVQDEALAKRFSEISPAKRYFEKSAFAGLRYSIIPVEQQPPPPIHYNLGSIVE